MANFETECWFCRGPITSTEIGDGDGEIVILVMRDGGIQTVAHRHPCYEAELLMMAIEELRRARSENFADWDSR